MSFTLTFAELDALKYALAVAGTHVARDIRKDKQKGECEEILRESEELLELQQTLVVQATVAPLDPSRPAQ